MKFCEKCGSYMQETKDGFVCRRCGNQVQANAVNRTMNTKKERSRAIYIVDSLEDVCQRCAHQVKQCEHLPKT